MKKLLIPALFSLLSYATVQSQDIQGAYDTSAEMLGSLKGSTSFLPLGLHQENIENIFDWSNGMNTRVDEMGDAISIRSVRKFHKPFLKKEYLSYLLEENPTHSLEGVIYYAPKNYRNAVTMLGWLGHKLSYNNNNFIVQVEDTHLPSKDIMYKFTCDDLSNLTSIHFQYSYLPKTLWPKLKSKLDFDADGMFDEYEKYFFDSLDKKADEDFDGDGVSNKNELDSHSNPVQNPRFAMRTVIVRWHSSSPDYIMGDYYLKDKDAFLGLSSNLFREALSYYKNAIHLIHSTEYKIK